MLKQDKELVERIRIAVEKQCSGCDYQDGKYCSWAKKQRTGNPSCQGKNHE